MQNLLKYRILIVLFLFCGLFLIVSVANTVKKRTDENTRIQDFELMRTIDSVPGELVKAADTSIKNNKDSLFIDGKSWRTGNELHIMY